MEINKDKLRSLLWNFDRDSFVSINDILEQNITVSLIATRHNDKIGNWISRGINVYDNTIYIHSLHASCDIALLCFITVLIINNGEL